MLKTIWLISFVVSYFYAKSILNRVAAGKIDDEPFSLSQKIIIFILFLLNPLSWGIFYQLFKNRLPSKTKELLPIVRLAVVSLITLLLIYFLRGGALVKYY